MIQRLIDTLLEAEVMDWFKDDINAFTAIIQQMRKDRKASKFKVGTLSCSGPTHHLVWSFCYKGSCHHLTN
jgi:hypothetical protein